MIKNDLLIAAAKKRIVAGGGSGNDSDTVLLLHCNGDETGNHTVTINGTPVLNAEHPIVQTERSDPNRTFGNSAYFNGTDAYYTVPDSADWDFGTAAFSADGWVKITSGDSMYFASQDADASNRWRVGVNINGKAELYSKIGGTNKADYVSIASITYNQWVHVEIVRDGANIYMFFDGVSQTVNEIVALGTNAFGSLSSALYIGHLPSNSIYSKGHVADIRISKGVARHTVGFTPPTEPYTSDASTVLLLAMSDLDQGDTSAPTDTSTGGAGSPHTVTNVSSKVVGCSWWWSGSMQFDGSTDKLVIADHTDFDFSGNFCVEFFVKFDAISNETVIGNCNFSAGSDGWGILINTTVIEFSGMYSGGFQISIKATSALVIGQRHHIAVSRSSGVVKIFQDGVDLSLTLNTGPSTAITGTNDLWIGTDLSSGFWFDGALSEIRISDTARYTSAFTPQTKPHVVDANTVLYLPLNGNQALGGEAHDITIANTGLIYAQEAENADYKTSFQFDGSTDYISIPDSDDWDIAGSASQDYTIDLWVKHDDHVGSEMYLSRYLTDNDRWQFYHVHGAGITFRMYTTGSWIIETGYGGEITDTNWHHVALVKVTSGGPTVEWGIYKDGTQVCYLSDSSTGAINSPLYVGSLDPSNNFFDGYLDEIRINKSNIFSASPVVGLTDTITIPTAPYDVAT